MPVRKIPRYGAQKNIGKFSSVKTGRVAWYESLNERDYMYLLDFDPASWVQKVSPSISANGIGFLFRHLNFPLFWKTVI
jgi:hypothetical protein